MKQRRVESGCHNEDTLQCCHCKVPIDSHKGGFRDSAERTFCCPGCRAVYALLSEKGLLYYYTLSEKIGATIPTVSDAEQPGVTPRTATHDPDQYTFQLDGIHCASCVWLLERLPLICTGVTSAQVSLARGEVNVQWDKGSTSLEEIQKAIQQLGYRVKPAHHTETHRAQSREALIQIGIAGAAAMNIMVLAVSLYQGEHSGIEPRYASLFRWVSFGLAIPAVAYSALPIYTRALAALKAGTLHIDVPITLGILLSFGLSALNTIRGSGEIYFDSVTTILFLLLASRFLHHRAFESARRAFTSSWSLLPSTIQHLDDTGATHERPLQELQAGMRLLVHAGERIPCDGIVERGDSSLDCSTITGESLPECVSEGSAVLAGTLNIESPLTVRAATHAGASQLDRILSSVSQSATTPPQFITSFDTLSLLFTAAALLLATGAFMLHIGTSFETASSAAIAMLTVTCPCAVALALPLLSVRALGSAASRGILVSSAQVFEDLPKIKAAFFDKTGTLTEANLKVSEARLPQPQDATAYSRDEMISLLSHLTRIDPKHPVSRALAQWLGEQNPQLSSVISIRESRRIPGRGVQISFCINADSNQPRIGIAALLSPLDKLAEASLGSCAPPASSLDTKPSCTRSTFVVDSETVATFCLSDSLRPEATPVVQSISRDCTAGILSGDSQCVVDSISRLLCAPFQRALGGLSPDEKAAIVREAQQPCMFVGDGANDAPALMAATVSVALRGGIQALVECANVCIIQGGIERLIELREIAHRYRRKSRRIIQLGLCYNGIGVAAALWGYITPLVAAVAMPIFSSIVIGIAYTAFSPASRSTKT